MPSITLPKNCSEYMGQNCKESKDGKHYQGKSLHTHLSTGYEYPAILEEQEGFVYLDRDRAADP